MRFLLIVAACVLMLSPAGLMRPAQADIGLRLSHSVHGTIGSMGTGWITLVDSKNKVLLITVPPAFKMPTVIQSGKKVKLSYIVNLQNQNVLVNIHDDQTGATSHPVISVPEL